MPQPFLGTAKGLLFAPRKTFPQLRMESLGSAFVYLLITLAAFVIFAAVFRIALLMAVFRFLPSGSLLALALAGMVFESVINFIGGIVLAVVTGAWIHLWAYIFGARRGIGETLRAAFYSFTPVGLLAWIPLLFAGGALMGGLTVLGPLAGMRIIGFSILVVIGLELLILGWGFLIAVYGVTDFQEIPERKAANALLLAYVIPLILGIAGFFLLLSAYSSGTGLPYA